jgi:GNAT superfamily N-acetyltransferase
MTWKLTGDVNEYLAAAGDFLRSRAAENTVLLAAAETVRVRGTAAFGNQSPQFGWCARPGGDVTGAFLHTSPYGVALTAMAPEVAAALADALADRGRFPSGVSADTGTGPAFAAAWQRRTGQRASIRVRSRLYRLGRLRPPDPAPPGRARVAVPADRDLLVAWLEAFHDEANPAGPSLAGRAADDRLSYGGLTLWETSDGPVSLAGLTRPAAGQVRIGPVYTPPDHRGQGFGGAVTAGVSKAARDAGVAEVLLYTDLANPTSNALYQRLGFEPVSDHVQLDFVPAGEYPTPDRP